MKDTMSFSLSLPQKKKNKSKSTPFFAGIKIENLSKKRKGSRREGDPSSRFHPFGNGEVVRGGRKSTYEN